MKLSLLFLQCIIDQPKAELLLNDRPNPRFSSALIIFENSAIVLYKEMVYVCSSSINVSCIDSIANSIDGIIWVGDTQPPPDSIPVLWLRESNNVVKVFNEVSCYFDFYNKWSEKLYTSFMRREKLDAIVCLMSQVTKNPFYFSDTSFRMLAISEDSDFEEMSWIWQYQTQHMHLPIDLIIKITESGELDHMNKSEHSIYVKSKAFNIPFISRTIFSDGAILGHFFIIMLYTNFNQCDLEISEYFGQVLSTFLKDNSSYMPTSGKYYENFFIDMIKGKADVVTDVPQLLHALNWKDNDCYYVTAIDLKSKETVPAFLAIHVLESYYNCCAFLYLHKIITIINFTRSQNGKIKKDQIMTIELLQDGFQIKEANVGCSESFNYFYNLKDYYLQAFHALTYGHKEREKINITYFSDIVLKYVFNEIPKHIPMTFLVHPAVNMLREYDRINNTDYAYTLKIFLIYDRSLVDTAKVLYIHRNTLVYRLEKIQSLINIDLSKTENKLRLLLSFLVLDEQADGGAHID